MDTIWTWGWCLIPFIFCGILALAFFTGLRRCGCGCSQPRDGNGRSVPGSAAL
jgi:hypothetical protein